MSKINVVSLFDGISCGQESLKRAGIKIGNYYASEIDKCAIQITQKNHPDTIQLGDVTNWRNWDIDWASIDLLIGGSPCQGFSFAGKQLNFNDPRSKLFFVYVDILRHIKKHNPNVKFLFENVKMSARCIEVITNYLQVKPVEINSALVSAQNRQRLYWTNINEIDQPRDKYIFLEDVLENLSDCPIGIKVREKAKCIRVGGRNSPFGSKQEWDSPYQKISKSGKLKKNQNKSSCIMGGAHSGGNHSNMDIIHTEFATRRYSAVECERLQTLPDNYTGGVSNTQRYKCLGNGWTVDVIVHILSYYKASLIKELIA